MRARNEAVAVAVAVAVEAQGLLSRSRQIEPLPRASSHSVSFRRKRISELFRRTSRSMLLFFQLLSKPSGFCGSALKL